MAKLLERKAFPEPESGGIPPLENGDRLTRAEFERRYSAMPHVKKAELLEGIVYMPSPVSHFHHGRPHAKVLAWLGQYCMATPGVDIGDNSTVRLDLDNEPQPDALLLIEPDHGGQVRFSEDGYIETAPDLVVETASSSASYDLHVKLNVYRRNGVKEYVVWRVRDRQIDWFILREGAYERQQPDAEGLYHSEVFPGLTLDVDAMVRGDLAKVGEVQRRSLETPAHAEFVRRLATP